MKNPKYSKQEVLNFMDGVLSSSEEKLKRARGQSSRRANNLMIDFYEAAKFYLTEHEEPAKVMEPIVIGKDAPQSLRLELQFSFNDVRRAAAMCGLSDLSDDRINAMFFKREKPLTVDVKEVTDGSHFEFCCGIVALATTFVALEENNEGLLGEMMSNNALGVGKDKK